MKFTRDQVIEMAREAGGGLESEHANLSALTRLCTLAADMALEAAAVECETIRGMKEASKGKHSS